jgi:purine-cytosine permease-like protein
MPEVEQRGIEAVPRAEQTAGARDLFGINFTFFVNPLMHVIGALAVTAGGLPLPWALAATFVGQALSFAVLVVIANAGTDYGVPGQVALRGTLGFWGARGLSSPYRMIAATYWFAAQALAGGLGIQALVEALAGSRPPLVPVAVALAALQAALAVLGLDVMRFLLRFVLPLTVAFTGLMVVLLVSSDDPRFAPGRVFESPDQRFTWLGFATYVTVVCGANFTFVTSVADFSRYTRTRRQVRVGLLASALTSIVITTFVGGYAAAATGETNPFVAVVELTSSDAIVVVLLAAIVVQTTAVNITNVYTAGMSLVNAAPRLGRLVATLAVGAAGVALAALPGVVEEAERWIVHLGNVAAPLAGVVFADFVLAKRCRLDVPALYDPAGRYRYLGGVNVAAVAAIAGGVPVYYAVPHEWLKVLWGAGVAAALYLVLARVTAVLPQAAPAAAGE